MTVKNSIEPSDVEWTMTWGEKYPDKPPTEQIFESDVALAHLLLNEIVFLNSLWWEKECPKRIQDAIAVAVNCNDVFAWGCADAEPLPYDEIENVYRMWKKDPHWGPAVWCMLRRKEMPQKPVEEVIRKAGIWDLDSLNLTANVTDAEIHARIADALRSPANGEAPQ